jgi:outer membrane protein assembly factor BamB
MSRRNGKGQHRRLRGIVAVSAAASLVVLSVLQGVLLTPTSMAATTSTPGANPADCPGGVLVPHAPITINTDADWTAANGVTGGSGTTSDPYVISCWSISVQVINTNGITIASGAGNLPFVIRDVQLTGPGGADGAGTDNQNGLQLSVTAAADIEQVTMSGLSFGFNGGVAYPANVGSVRIANSLFSGNYEGIGNGSRAMDVESNLFTGNGYGIYSASGVIKNNTISDNANGTQGPSGLITGNTVENNSGNGLSAAGTVRGNIVRNNGTGVVPQQGAVVDSNLISSNVNFGIDISTTIAATITNNTIQNNGQAGIVANYVNNPPFDDLSTDNLIQGNHIGGNPFGIAFSYGTSTGNVVSNTDWTEGHASYVRFSPDNSIVDAGSSHQGTTDQPVFFHDYIAGINTSPGPNTPNISCSNPAINCQGGLSPEPTVQYAAVTGVHWDFGDGQGLDLCTPGSATQCTAIASQGHGPEPDVTHTYASTGSYTATLTVTATTAQNPPQTVTLSDTTPVIIASSPPTSLGPASSTGSPWPMLGNTPDRPFYNGSEVEITKSNVAQLVPKWRFPTNFSVTASPAVATVNLPGALGGAPTPHKVVFDGAFDGSFYAIDAATGLPLWSDCLVTGPTDTPASCDPQYPGNTNAPTDYGVIVASPEVASVTLASGQTQSEVLAAANATMSALDPSTGKVLWSFNGGVTGYLGEPTCPQVPGQGCEDLTYEIESSPVVVGNTVIFGIDCNGMCQKGGGIYAIDARDGHMLWFFDPGAGQAYPGSATTFAYNPKMNGPSTEATCGGVWTSPTIDASLGLLYASTANCTTQPLPPYEEAVFAVNIATGAPAWQWQPRPNDALDMDFGATPNVFNLGSEDVVGAGSKDGTYTLLDAKSGALKWSTKVALGGSFGGFYNATTDGTKIYLTSALAEASAFAGTPVEESFKGREYALDARTGNLVWRSYAGGPSLGQDSAVNGGYFTGGLDHMLHAWDSATGNLLTALPLAGASSSGPVIAGGEVFIGAGTGATFRSAVGPCTPGNFLAGIPPSACPPAPEPVGEYGQGIWGFCISSDTACATSIATIAGSRHPTKLTYAGATSDDVDDPATLSATLSDTTNPAAPSPVPNEQVTLTLYEQSCTATTDSNGNASCSVTPNEASGSYTASATFLGDSSFQQSSTQAPFTLNQEETTLTYSGPTSIPDGGPVTLSGVLEEDGSTAIQGRGVTFTLGSGSSAQSCSGITDSNGTATCSIDPVIQPLGSGTVSASFAGDAYFKPVSTAPVTTSDYAYTGSSGAFAIGNGNATVGNSVTFWGNNWSTSNTLSGGTAPSAFKGFVQNPSPNPPTCGGTWTTPTGNTSTPPGSVPQYMAVVVTSRVTLTNSTTAAGNVVEIVVIATNPGYDGNPGHAGTGTVLGIICHT